MNSINVFVWGWFLGAMVATALASIRTRRITRDMLSRIVELRKAVKS